MISRPVSLAKVLALLPPLSQETIWLGALLTARLSDSNHTAQARALIAELELIRADTLEAAAVPADVKHKPSRSNLPKRAVDPEELRAALLDERKLAITYIDGKGAQTQRTVWPLDVEDYGPNGAMLCWCEKRRDFRHFRFDRVVSMQPLAERTAAPRSVMRAFAEVMMRDGGDY
jgi:predicted DNA-binding transcriptional regulator YafY